MIFHAKVGKGGIIVFKILGNLPKTYFIKYHRQASCTVEYMILVLSSLANSKFSGNCLLRTTSSSNKRELVVFIIYNTPSLPQIKIRYFQYFWSEHIRIRVSQWDVSSGRQNITTFITQPLIRSNCLFLQCHVSV